MHLASYASGLLTGASVAVALLLLWQSFTAPPQPTSVPSRPVVINQAPATVISPSLEQTLGY